jgi:3-dehydroquinate synthase
VGLPTRAPLPGDAALDAAMRHDKKVAAGRIRFVLPTRLGAVELCDDVPAPAIHAAWSSIRAS